MARLPEPGSDSGVWGAILNEYLSQSHQTDGSLKDGSVKTSTLADNAITAAKLAPGSVTSTAITQGAVSVSAIQDNSLTEAKIADGAISANKLHTAMPSAADNGKVLVLDNTVAGGFKWDTVSSGASAPSGPASGDLTGTYPGPEIAVGAVTNDKIADGSVTGGKIDSTLMASLDSPSDWNATSGRAAILNKPTIPDSYTKTESDDRYAASSLLASKADISSLSTVATSGSYVDLTNKPVIPAQINPIAGANVAITGTYPDLTFAATQNDSFLLSRDNHTGTQAISTVTNLQSSLDAKLDETQLSTDSALGTSDSLVPSQNAVKTYVDTRPVVVSPLFAPFVEQNSDGTWPARPNGQTIVVWVQYPGLTNNPSDISAGHDILFAKEV